VDSQTKSSGLVLGRRPLGAVLHSSNEPSELSQRPCHDDSTRNIVLDIIIILLSASLYFSKRGAYWDRLCRDVVGCQARALWPNGAF